MGSSSHTATIEDDQRHVPGPASLPLWNESFWFPCYDPRTEIGVVFRAGMHPNRQEANLYVFITHHGAVVHSLVDQRAPLPAFAPQALAISGLRMEWESRERFQLHYAHATHGFDLVWEGCTPTYRYPIAPETTADQVSRHIEHAGVVTGTVTIGGEVHRIDCLGHRDHSWGGERDWNTFYSWDYLSGEIDRDFWFNAVRIQFFPEMPDLHIGCVWAGNEVLELAEIKMDVRTADGGTRQLGVTAELIDARRRPHVIVAEEILVNCVVQFGRTWLKDGIARYRYGDRVGYGIHEHGYIEGARAR